MAFCLIKSKADEFLKAIKDGKLDINELSAMTSAERLAKFIKVLGLDKATAKEVNALFESKLLLKYQKRGMINWIEKTAGLKEEVKRDLMSRVQRMDKVLNPTEEKAFLSDLAEKRLGTEVTQEEAKNIFDLSKVAEKKKALIKEDSPIGSKNRIEYGIAHTMFQDYVKDLKLDAQKMSIKDYLKKPQEILYQLGGITKSMLATLDNSFFGRQGIKVLYTKPTLWAKNFMKSWGDIGRVLKGTGFKKIDGMLPIKADVFSRPNALNGRYTKMKLDVGLTSEEAFPSALPERAPILGRLFQASEVAFNGGAMRMRADLADKYLKIAEKNGVDIDNAEQLKGIGQLVNSTTGRGSLGKAETIAKEVNALMFSVKFLKSNIDTLTLHLFDPKATKFTKQQAAKNLMKIIVGVGTVLATAKAINPDSVDFDPRSSNFGKIKIGNTRIGITGGMGSLVSLATRLLPTKHNGEWGLWFKSSTSGKWTNLTEGKYGQMTAMDIFDNFWQGKLAPMTGLLRDVWRGQNFDREKVTIGNAAKNLTTPISAQQFQEFMDAGISTEKIILFMLLEVVGFGTTLYK